jgi:hypothetical protein
VEAATSIADLGPILFIHFGRYLWKKLQLCSCELINIGLCGYLMSLPTCKKFVHDCQIIFVRRFKTKF